MSTRSEKIRAFLRMADGPQTTTAIVTAVPGRPTHYAVGVMYRAGILARDGEPRRFRYWIAREAVPRVKLPIEELRARRQARERRLYQARRGSTRTAAEYRADRAQKKVLRLAGIRADRERRQQAKAAVKKSAAQRAKPGLPAAPKPSRQGQFVIAPGRRRATRMSERTVEAESVAAWMARTGQRVEHLPNGAVSQPLLRIGF
jgi:hypothetical protein